MSAGFPLRLPTRIAAAIIACLVSLLSFAPAASGFQLSSRWSTTATGSTGSQGSPITLTWSFVPDGTSGTGHGTTSNLRQFLDAEFGVGTSGTDLTKRTWYPLFSQSLDRWSQLSGVTFHYEPNDSNVAFNTSSGSIGLRGDIRIAGANIDGPSNPGAGTGLTLGQTSLPNFGDMLLDTTEGATFSSQTSNYLEFRNTVMHEAGHALGLVHVISSTNSFLMEPNISTAFDGPQLDDILGVQSYYGDFYEKSNSGQGNDTAAHATALGAIAIGGSKSIGTSPAAIAARPPNSQYVLPTDTDFLSIDNSSDTDFFSFSISAAARLSVALTPRGGSYMQGPQGGSESLFNASAQSALSLAIYSTNGTTQLALANSAAAGQAEILSNLALSAAGQYYVRVTGAANIVQLYDLQLAVATPFQTGDYNHSGKVDAADYTVWRDTLGRSGLGLAADGNGNGIVDSADYGVWKTNFGVGSGAGGGSVGNGFPGGEVPEPATLWLAAVGGYLWIFARRLRHNRFA